jgi:hypothetical protein
MNHTKSDKIIAIHQPNYIPWLGYFYKIYQSDVFVFLDDAQFSNEGMHNYTYIKTYNGSFRLKYPVQQSLGDKINMVRSKDELGWKAKHLAMLETNYRNAPYFKEVMNNYREVILKEFNNIAVLNIRLIKLFTEKLAFKTEFINASDLNITLNKEEKIISICDILGGSVYYSGTGAMAYQKEENFNTRGIELRYSIFTPFEYPQLWNGFQSNVTALDYFMNCGYDWDRVLRSQKLNI